MIQRFKCPRWMPSEADARLIVSIALGIAVLITWRAPSSLRAVLNVFSCTFVTGLLILVALYKPVRWFLVGLAALGVGLGLRAFL